MKQCQFERGEYLGMELYEILGLGAENLRAENTYLPHQAVSRQNKQMKIFEIKK